MRRVGLLNSSLLLVLGIAYMINIPPTCLHCLLILVLQSAQLASCQIYTFQHWKLIIHICGKSGLIGIVEQCHRFQVTFVWHMTKWPMCDTWPSDLCVAHDQVIFVWHIIKWPLCGTWLTDLWMTYGQLTFVWHMTNGPLCGIWTTKHIFTIINNPKWLMASYRRIETTCIYNALFISLL